MFELFILHRIADRCFLSGRHIHHAGESIFAILGRAQQHATAVGDDICEPDISGEDGYSDRCCPRIKELLLRCGLMT